MSNCCDNGVGFPDAALMEQLSTNHPVIWQEICTIQQSILEAANSCTKPSSMCTTVGGKSPMTFVSGIESISVVNGGSGYVVDRPMFKLVPAVGMTVDAAVLDAVVVGGSVAGISVVYPGSGYAPIHSTARITSLAGSGAGLVVHVTDLGAVSALEIVDPGTGYQVGDSVIVTRAVGFDPSFIECRALVSGVSSSGEVLSVRILDPGSGYQPAEASIIAVSSLLPSTPYPIGAGLAVKVNVGTNGEVLSISISSGGFGYNQLAPQVDISGIGSGATAVPTISGQSVSSISVTANGYGYTDAVQAYVSNPYTAPSPNQPAVLSVTVNVNRFGTDPNHYYRVWQGSVVDKSVQLQISAVVGYFTKLKYTITPVTNPSTGSTLMWKICW